jgi:hypothetical protein
MKLDGLPTFIKGQGLNYAVAKLIGPYRKFRIDRLYYLFAPHCKRDVAFDFVYARQSCIGVNNIIRKKHREKIAITDEFIRIGNEKLYFTK